jgi:ATP-dependent Clp protease ATP-binding subunit ClpA
MDDSREMLGRFTDSARRVIVLAHEEARTLNHTSIGTEHILLGLIREGGEAMQALEALGLQLESVRQQVKEIIGQGEQARSGPVPFTARAKKVLELSLREAQWSGHSYIGPEHILVGLLREGDGVAAQVLLKLGADLKRVRIAVLRPPRDPDQEPRDDDSSRDQRRAARRPVPLLAERVRQLSEEIERLRALLRENGIDPDEGAT